MYVLQLTKPCKKLTDVGVAVAFHIQNRKTELGNRIFPWLEEHVGSECDEWIINFEDCTIKFKETNKAVAFKIMFGEHL